MTIQYQIIKWRIKIFFDIRVLDLIGHLKLVIRILFKTSLQIEKLFRFIIILALNYCFKIFNCLFS